jgi:sRNA-binding carbon storage regulator CsrA
LGVNEIGVLKLKPGEHIRVGDALVTFLERERESAYVVFQAPRTVPIFRDGRLSVRERQPYSRGPSRRSA